MKAICGSCNKHFDLHWDDYHLDRKVPNNVHVSASVSSGVYAVRIECPHCHKVEDIK